MTAEQEQLWTAFREQGSQAARETLILAHLRYVEPTLRRVLPNIPARIERDDLEAEARLAVVRAIDRFDPTRQIGSATWVVASIRHQLLDYLRDEDWLPRLVRAKIKRLEAAERTALAQFGESGDRHVGAVLGMDMGEVQQLRREATELQVISLDATAAAFERDDEESAALAVAMTDPAPLPLDQVMDRWEVRVVRRLVAALPDQQRQVVEGRYLRGLKQREIAREMSLSESRIQQVIVAGMSHLHDLARARRLL